MGSKAFHVLLVFMLIICGVPALMGGVYLMGRGNKYPWLSSEDMAYTARATCIGFVVLVLLFFAMKYLIDTVW
jgi:hypothetical protein